MDVAVYPTHLTYRVIGGILDLSFFGGPGPEQVVRQYQQVIGASCVCV
jgi:alpha-glucosidase